MDAKLTSLRDAVQDATMCYKDALKSHMQLQKSYAVPHESVAQAEELRQSRAVVERMLHAYTCAVRRLVEAEVG